MNQAAFDGIRSLLEEDQIEYHVFTHEICRTSAESAEARSQAGYSAIGAKALVIKLTLADGSNGFATLVLPGPDRLDSRKLKQELPEVRKFRFATEDELRDLCGVPIGAMPPFGKTIFPTITSLFVDNRLREYEYVGFNAAALTTSIVMRCVDYLTVAKPTRMLNFTA